MNATASKRVGILLKYVVPLLVTVGLCWLLLRGMDQIGRASCRERV